MLMLVAMISILMQGHSGSLNAKFQLGIISTTKQATSIKLSTTAGHFFVTLTLNSFIWLDYLVVSVNAVVVVVVVLLLLPVVGYRGCRNYVPSWWGPGSLFLSL